MGFAKIIVAIGAVVFLGITAWSFSTSVPVDWAAFTDDPWVALAMADLYLGFVLLAVMIALLERSPVRAALWIIPLFFVGNLVAAVYLLLNLNRIGPALKRAREGV